MTKAIKMDSAKVRKSWIETICGIKHKKLLSYLRLEFNINFIQRRMPSNASMYRENFLKFKMATIIVWNLRNLSFRQNVVYERTHIFAWKDIDFELGARYACECCSAFLDAQWCYKCILQQPRHP